MRLPSPDRRRLAAFPWLYYLTYGIFTGAIGVQCCVNAISMLYQCYIFAIKKAGASSSGFHLVHIKPVFHFRHRFVQMPGYAASAVIDSLLGGYLHIQHTIDQFKIYHFPVDRFDAGGAADQFHNLVAVQLPAHQRFERDDFAVLIRSPSLRHAGPQCFHALPLR